MLLEQERHQVSSSGVLQTAKATIKATPKIFNFFADQTYSDKPVAITRELVANAIDAHTAAGKADVPVEVWLPGELDPIYRVRDRGIGMSHDFMMTRFMAYTDGSTKDQSNDQIGGFGIGSKSPFAYTDQFTIRSVHNGVVSVYTIFKDEDGIPAIGLLAQGATDEPNGVEVSFPVKSEDHETFIEAAQSALQYFVPLPIVHNGSVTPPAYIATGKGWALREKAGSLGVIMGGVRYPVSTSSLPGEIRWDTRLKPLLDYGIDLTLPIGACGVALSRESLSYDDRTAASIRAGLEATIEEVIAGFSTMFDSQPSWWEARKALAREVSGNYARGQLLSNNALYRGQKLDADLTTAELLNAWSVLEKKRRGGARIGSAKWNLTRHFRPASIQKLIIDDLPIEPKSRTIQRIKHYAAEEADWNADRPLIALRSSNIPAMLRLLGDPPRSDYVFTSELPVPVIERAARDRGSRPRVRMFRHDGTGLGTGYGETVRINPNVAFEIPYAEQPLIGILVTLNLFELPAGFITRMRSGLIRYDELHFVNQGDAAKLKGWQHFDDVFNKRLAEALALYPELPARLALANDDNLSDIFKFIRNNRVEPKTASSPYGRIVQLYDRYVAPLTPDQFRLAPYVIAKIPPRIDTQKLREAFNTKHWKAARILQLTTMLADNKLFQENL